ncbi:MAG TPA: class I SAM-dependent methyltransferase [Acidimicrobiales bacterium]|jgi:SAM-dependent methyltransferase|nr:class I SAM-dependent methyltransferase [Acidimicrobiales bacterium]
MRYTLRLADTALRLPHKRAQALLARDYLSWVRLEFLGAASRLGLLAELVTPHTTAELAGRLGVTEAALFEAFLEVGRTAGELGRTDGRWVLRGSRAKALADPAVDGLAGISEELTFYDADVYDAAVRRLRGEAPGDYLPEHAAVVARASRAAEPLLRALLHRLVQERQPQRVLEVGCGSGVNLRHVGESCTTVTGCGIEVEPEVVALAKANLAAWDLDSRFEVREADVGDLPDDLAGPWDLVVLAQNIYYFAPADRPPLLARLRALAPQGAVVIATAVAGLGDPVAANLDLVLRSTAGTYALPTAQELRADLSAAGFTTIDERRLAPFQPLRAFVAA